MKRSWENMAVEPMELYAVVDSVAVEGTRTLHVFFEERHRSMPRALAAPPFAVTKGGGGSRWLMGTGRYSIEGVSHTMTARSEECVLRFVAAGRRDPRDMLESDVDLMLTTDPRVLGYAERRAHLTTLALPWDRTYVLVSATRVESLRRGEHVDGVLEALTDALARDAVRVDARGYRGQSWWSEIDDCGKLVVGLLNDPPIPAGAYATGQRHVVYDSADPIARDLAQRIVALAVADPDRSADASALAAAVPGLSNGESGIVAHGVTSGELALSLWSGDDFAYVIAVPRLTPDPCYAARQLANRAPWLAPSSRELADALVPLVDTRSHVIARREHVALIADGLGNIMVSNGTKEAE